MLNTLVDLGYVARVGASRRFRLTLKVLDFGFNDIAPVERLKPPSAEHWFGTDNLGRDLLSRCIHGAQLSVIIGCCAAALATLISAVVGIVSGYFGGRFDLLVQRFVDHVRAQQRQSPPLRKVGAR